MATPTQRPHRRTQPKPTSKTAKRLAADLSNQPRQRRVVSGRDRRFIQLFADAGYRDPDKAAVAAGFKEPYVGDRLTSRLRDLIDAERIRRSMDEQMELDEALRELAKLARFADRPVDQHAALRTVLQVHGALSDKPLPVGDRRSLTQQVTAMVEKIAKVAGKAGGGGTVRLRAAIAKVEEKHAIDLEIDVPSSIPTIDLDPDPSTSS